MIDDQHLAPFGPDEALPCGCRLFRDQGQTGLARCPLHAAALALYRRLERARRHIEAQRGPGASDLAWEIGSLLDAAAECPACLGEPDGSPCITCHGTRRRSFLRAGERRFNEPL